jgi:hypothetical protein
MTGVFDVLYLFENVFNVFASLFDRRLGLIGVTLGFELVVAGGLASRLFRLAGGVFGCVLNLVSECHVDLPVVDCTTLIASMRRTLRAVDAWRSQVPWTLPGLSPQAGDTVMP